MKYLYYKYCSINVEILNYNIISNNIDLKWIYKYDTPEVEKILRICKLGEKFIINDHFIEAGETTILILPDTVLEHDDYLDNKLLKKLKSKK